MTPATKQQVEFLADEYAEAMQKQNDAGQNPPFDIPAMLGALANFRQFVVEYLKANTPQQLLTNIDGNYGVQLTNLKQYLVGVPIDVLKGTMQPSVHTAVTGQQTANDMQQAGAIPLTQASNLIPPNAVNFEAAGGNQDMSVQQPTVRYDQQHPAVRAS